MKFTVKHIEGFENGKKIEDYYFIGGFSVSGIPVSTLRVEADDWIDFKAAMNAHIT